MAFGQAIDHALAEAMAQDETVVTFGEDVRLLRRELLVRFGPQRVRDTSISEAAFVHLGIGAAMTGLRPVVDVMMTDFLGVAWSAIVNGMTKFTDFSGGRWPIPLVLRVGVGGWYSDGGQHSQALWGQLASVPGLDVVVPSTPEDAAGLMLAAIRADRPVAFLEPKLLSEQWLDYLGGSSRTTVDFASVVPAAGARGPVESPVQPIGIGTAATRREGGDVVLVSVGVGVHRCLAAAESLAREGIEARVLDLRSIAPLDVAQIVEAARATGAVVVVDEDYRRGGLSGEIAAILLEHGIPATYARVTVEGTIPHAPELEYAALPNPARIEAAVRQLLT